MRRDLRWWQSFLPRWNGIKILRSLTSRPSSHIWTDASGNWGIGGFRLRAFGDEPHEVFSQRYTTKYRNRNADIQVKEMDAVLFALRL